MKQIEQKLKDYLDTVYIISHSYSTFASYRLAITNQNKTGFRDYLQQKYNIDELKFVKQTKKEKFDVYAILRDFVVFLDQKHYKPKSITARLAAMQNFDIILGLLRLKIGVNLTLFYMGRVKIQFFSNVFFNLENISE